MFYTNRILNLNPGPSTVPKQNLTLNQGINIGTIATVITFNDIKPGAKLMSGNPACNATCTR